MSEDLGHAPAGERRGGVLVVAVVLSLAGLLLAHGALVLVRSDLAAARTSERVLRVEALAAGAARRAASLPTRDGVSRGATADSLFGLQDRTRWTGRLVRVRNEVWVAEGAAMEGDVRRRVALPLWAADPAARASALGGVVVTGGSAGVSGAGRIDPSRFEDVPIPEPSAGCLPAGGGAGTVLPWAVDPDSTPAGLGMLGPDSLEARADVRVVGGGTPSPSEAFGACLTGPWNWGDPERSGRPCSDLMRTVALAPGAIVDGGVGQGLLVADGDLVLRDASFYGVILLQGRLRVEGSARVTGAVWARAGVSLAPEARIVGSRCWTEAGLSGPALRRPTPARPVRWMRLGG